MSPLTYLRAGGAVALLLLVGAVFTYVQSLRGDVADANARMSVQQATINEQEAAARQNQQAIDELRAARALDDRIQADEANSRQAIVTLTGKAKEHIHHVQISDTACRGADARDIDTLDQLRILLAAAAGRGDADGKDSAAGGAAGGHSPATIAGQSDQP